MIRICKCCGLTMHKEDFDDTTGMCHDCSDTIELESAFYLEGQINYDNTNNGV